MKLNSKLSTLIFTRITKVNMLENCNENIENLLVG